MKHRIIPGEKSAIKKAIAEKKEKYGQLPRKEVKRIAHQVHKKMKRKAQVGALLAMLGITTGVAGVALVSAGTSGKGEPTVEETGKGIEPETKKDTFAGKIKVTNSPSYAEIQAAENEINALENKEDVLKYLKNLYVEQCKHQFKAEPPRTYNGITPLSKYGSKELNADEIYLIESSQNYLFVNEETGEFITHGDEPEKTKECLKEENIKFHQTQDEYQVYEVVDEHGDVRDAFAMEKQGDELKPVRVFMADEVHVMDIQTEPVLVNMGDVMKEGFEYIDSVGEPLAKSQFTSAVAELKHKNNQETIEKTRNKGQIEPKQANNEEHDELEQ